MDLDETGNVAQRVRITRIGESLLLSIGFSYNLARDNVGVQFLIEPRFMNAQRLLRVAGVSVGPPGQFGLDLIRGMPNNHDVPIDSRFAERIQHEVNHWLVDHFKQHFRQVTLHACAFTCSQHNSTGIAHRHAFPAVSREIRRTTSHHRPFWAGIEQAGPKSVWSPDIVFADNHRRRTLNCPSIRQMTP